MDSATGANVSPTHRRGGKDDGRGAADGPPQIVLRTKDGRDIPASAQSLQRLPDGSYRLLLGGTDLDELSAAVSGAGGAAAVIPVVAEDIEVGKQTVESGRVRVRKTVEERQETVDQPLASEEVVVERVPVNRVVAEAPSPRQEGDTLILPVLEEVLVVEKRLMLREEVRVTSRRSEIHRPQTVTLRRENVEIERTGPDSAPQGT